MAANKFATMLHNRTNKITLILVYAFLEWILIILLLLNSLFSYLIIKFADYFGLKRPCLWCSRVDHVLDPHNTNHSYKDLVCESHAHEISKLGYCFNHRKLAQILNMCDDCSSSSSSSSQQNSHGVSKIITFMIREGDEKKKKMGVNGVANSKCSCCDVNLDMESKHFYSPCLLIKPNWGVLDYTQKPNSISIKEAEIDEGLGIEETFNGQEMLLDVNGGEGKMEEEVEEEEGSSSLSDFDCDDEVLGLVNIEKEKGPLTEEALIHVSMDDPSSCDDTTTSKVQASRLGEDASFDIPSQHLEYYIDNDDLRLIPVGLIDSTTAEKGNETKLFVEGKAKCDRLDAFLPSEHREENDIELGFEDMCNSSILVAKGGDLIMEMFKEVSVPQETQNFSKDDDDGRARGAGAENGDINSDDHLASEEVFRTNETEARILMGTEIPEQERTAEVQTQHVLASYSCIGEDPSTSSSSVLYAEDDHVEEDLAECKIISAEMTDQKLYNHMSISSDHREMEEEKVPDTPNSVDHLHKKMLLLEKREWGTEESLDGSVLSEFEAGEGDLTVESLKSALRTKRKALNGLYVELEEERSASAIAANQTMAMINRLQEEKAAMQMEALQYQRMMDEQSEYDQEALQLMNELMVKREREKQELEKELEIYRKKVFDYEAKEKMKMLKRVRDDSIRSRTSTASCSNAEDSDGLSIDLNQELRDDDGFYRHQESGNHNTPVDAVLNLDESLADFEGERLLILDQLRILEEKLFSLADEEEWHLDDMKPFEQFYEENGKEFEERFNNSSELNGGVGNGFPKEMNGKHQEESRIMGSRAKRLLPLFDAISAETEVVVMNDDEEGFNSSQPFQVTKFESDHKKLAIEDEVDHLYERLHALEADKEFLKHCVGSLKKGEKGMDLLQEILQHLRDLRNVELRVKNVGDGPLV